MEFARHFTTIDLHAGGEPLRVITGGLPFVKGETMLARSAYFQENLDHFRRVLMHEPRGHHGMHGCLLIPPVHEDADIGVLFMNHEGLSTMCGHGIIAVATLVIETGILPWTGERKEIVIDTPAGKVVAFPEVEGTRVKSVSFDNVPSFVYRQDLPLTVQGKSFTVDIAYGGAFYAVVQASDLGVKAEIEQLPALQKWAKMIKEEIEAQMPVQHPHEKELRGIHGVIFSDAPKKPDSHLRNVTIFADGQIGRSPCGTGTSARMAVLYQKGQLRVGDRFIHESIIGSQFTGTIIAETEIGPYRAIIPRIKGRAFITGMHQFVVDPSDPLSGGFLLK